MSYKALQECKSTIQLFVTSNSLPRLKEMLPVIFDCHMIYTLETQRRILLECSLTPVMCKHQMSICLEPSSPQSNPDSYPPALISTPSASERSWPSSEEIEPG